MNLFWARVVQIFDWYRSRKSFGKCNYTYLETVVTELISLLSTGLPKAGKGGDILMVKLQGSLLGDSGRLTLASDELFDVFLMLLEVLEVPLDSYSSSRIFSIFSAEASCLHSLLTSGLTTIFSALSSK